MASHRIFVMTRFVMVEMSLKSQISALETYEACHRGVSFARGYSAEMKKLIKHNVDSLDPYSQLMICDRTDVLDSHVLVIEP